MASWCYNQDFKEEEQASGSNEKKMSLAVEDDKVTLSEDSSEKALTPEDLINKVLKWVITSYFICLGKTRWEQGAHEPSKCGRLMTSKQWDKRKHDTQEAWVPRQRWYCTCGAKYQAGWGQVMIIEESDGTVSYVRAQCPPWDLEDVRAMKTEATVSAESVKELYDKIHSMEPSVNDIVGTDAEGCKYIKNQEDLEAMPFFSWDEVLSFQQVLGSKM